MREQGKCSRWPESVFTIARIRKYCKYALSGCPPARIRFIKHAQQSGFSLKEISELLLLDDSHCSDVRKIAEQKLQKIDEQIYSLTMLRNILDTLVQGCHSNPSAKRCSLIKAISDKSNEKE